MLSKFFIASLSIAANALDPTCKVASPENQTIPNFRYDGKDYGEQPDYHTSISSMFCHSFIGYEIFDFRHIDKYMRDAPEAALFEGTGAGA